MRAYVVIPHKAWNQAEHADDDDAHDERERPRIDGREGLTTQDHCRHREPQPEDERSQARDMDMLTVSMHEGGLTV